MRFPAARNLIPKARKTERSSATRRRGYEPRRAGCAGGADHSQEQLSSGHVQLQQLSGKTRQVHGCAGQLTITIRPQHQRLAGFTRAFGSVVVDIEGGLVKYSPPIGKINIFFDCIFGKT